jgi:uncharacterized surface protein with fasciclin (FAS1) repeats
MKRNTAILLALFTFIVGTFVGYGLRNSRESNPQVLSSQSNKLSDNINLKPVFEIIQTNKDISVFNKALNETGFADPLQSQGPFTVFAPTDNAFVSLPSEQIADLQKPENKTMLQQLVSYHIISGEFQTKDLQNNMKLSTINGKEVTITIKNKVVSINGVPLMQKDLQGSNGVIHSVGTVLKPPDEPEKAEEPVQD